MNVYAVDGKRIADGLRRYGLGGVVVAAIVWCVSTAYFSVPATHFAYVTRFGRVVSPEAGPLGPGLHFKVPFVDHADRLRVSIDTIALDKIQAYTKDTQPVSLQLSITYSIPRESVYRLLYEVGRAGNVDIESNVNAVTNDRVRSIVGQHDIVRVAGEGREEVIRQIKTVLTDELRRLFAIDVHDVQLAALNFSQAYEESINQATLSKTAKLKAELERDRKKIEAEAAVAEATGRANAEIESARGRKLAAIAAAEGEAESISLHAKADAGAIAARGAAEAEALRAKVAAGGGAESYVRYVQAQAALNWKGEVPSTMLGGGAGTTSIAMLPLPQTTTTAAQR